MRTAVTFFLLLLVGCRNSAAPEPEAPTGGDGSLPALPSASSSVLAGNLLLSGSSVLVGDPSTLPSLIISVTARNTTMEAVSLEDICVVQLRAHRDSSAIEAVWKAPDEPAATCSSPGPPREIPPGGEFSLPRGEAFLLTRARDILGDELDEGDYAFTALVRVGSETVPVPAGRVYLSRDTRPPLQDPTLLRYAAQTSVEGIAPRSLVTRVAATNPTDRNVYVEYGACSLRLRAYRNPERTGPPVWRSEYRRAPGVEHGYACLGYLAMSLITPGAVISPPEFNARIPLHEILGDSLPGGQYYFSAVLEFQRGAGLTLTHDTIRIPAGSAELVSTVDPLPQEREVDGILYRAETAADPNRPNTLHVELTATNTRPGRMLLVGSQGSTCPTQLVGYHSAELRDQWYVIGSGDWYAPSCPLRIPPTWLDPGESQTFSAEVTAFTREGEEGRYHLVLHVGVAHEPGGGHRTTLSAGEATLSAHVRA